MITRKMEKVSGGVVNNCIKFPHDDLHRSEKINKPNKAYLHTAPPPKITNVLDYKIADGLFNAIFQLIVLLVKLFVGLIVGAAIWFVLGALVPELRDKLNNFYVLVDFILLKFNDLCAYLVDVIPK